MPITTTGIGSGLDVNNIVTTLVKAERAPEEQRLTTKETEIKAKISAFGTIKSKLSSVSSAISTLKSMSTFTKRSATSSDESVLTATATNTATLNNYSIGVEKIAKSHSFVTAGFSGQQAVIGTGTITLRFGEITYGGGGSYDNFTVNGNAKTSTITIDSTNNTVSGFRDYINSGSFGVRASIIDDGGASNNFRLVLTSENTGKDYAIELVTDDNDNVDNDAAGLSVLAYSKTVSGLVTETQKGQNAKISVNGFSIERSSNTILSAVDGVTLNLKKETSVGSTVSLGVTRNSTGVEDSVNSFVTAYNDYITEYNKLTTLEDEDGKVGLLLGDATMRNINSLLRTQVGSVIDGLTGSYRALADIGIVAKKDGTLGVTESKLTAAASGDLDALGRLFAPIGVPTKTGVSYLSSNSLTKAGTYAVNVTQLATQGTLTGSGVLPNFGGGGSLDIDAENESMQFRINGIATGEVKLTNGNYTSGTTLAAELQSKINSDSNLIAKGISVGVSYDSGNNRFVIRSSEYGAASKVAIIAADTNTLAELGFNINGSGAVDGLNVVGKIDGVDATGVGRELVSINGNSNGLKLFITASATGDLGTVTFTRGFSTEFGAKLSSIIDAKGIIPSQNTGFSTTLTRIADDRETLNYRMQKYEARLYAQFNLMDSIVANLQSTNTFLSQALENLPGTVRQR